MNPSFRPRRPILRRTLSRSRTSSSSSDSVKIDSPPNQSSANRSKPPNRRRAHSKSRSPQPIRRTGSRARTHSRSPLHSRTKDRLARGNERPLDELKNITIDIRRSLSGDNATLRRDIVVNPSNVVVVRRPDENYTGKRVSRKHACSGEGSRPLFDREELKVHSSEERRIISKSASPTKSDRSDRKRRDRETDRDRHRRDRTRSRSRSRGRLGRHLIDQRYVHKLRRTRSRSPRSRRRSRSRSGDRRRDRDRRGRSREREEPFPMVPMYPVPLRPRIPMFGPVLPYPRGFMRFPLRVPRVMRYFPRPYPPFRVPFNPS